MKRILFTIIFINLLLSSKAQKGKIEYGFQSGLNISTAYGEGVSKDYMSPLSGLHVGGHLKINRAEHWGFKFLLSYDKIGWTYKSLSIQNNAGTGLVKADILFKLDYLNIPVLAEYSFGNKLKINFDGGPFLGILLNNKIATNLMQPIPPNQEASSQISSNNRKTLNIGLSLGSSIQIPVASKLKLDFNVKNNLGITNIYKSGSGAGSTIKTNTFSILAGLTFEM